MQHVPCPHGPEFQIYWDMRYRLFSKFDEAIDDVATACGLSLGEYCDLLSVNPAALAEELEKKKEETENE